MESINKRTVKKDTFLFKVLGDYELKRARLTIVLTGLIVVVGIFSWLQGGLQNKIEVIILGIPLILCELMVITGSSMKHIIYLSMIVLLGLIGIIIYYTI